MSDKIFLREGKRLDDLMRSGRKIIQAVDEFCFSMDAVLIAHFPRFKKNARVIDLGTGTGVIPLLIADNVKQICAVELNSKAADLARRNVELNGLSDKISVSSAASKPTDGGTLHQGIAAKLGMEKIPFKEHIARTITPKDYAENDLIVCMDAGNVEQVKGIVGGDPDGKIFLLMDFAGFHRDVADPWYTGDFEAAWRDVLEGCRGLLEQTLYKG